MAKHVLSLAAFTAWLKTKHPRTKVGVSCEADFCPLAKFLTQTTGIPHEVNGEDGDGSDSYVAALLDKDGKVVRDFDGNVKYDYQNARGLPQWAIDFIGEVDDSSGDSVSAAAALKIAESSTLGRASRQVTY